MTHPWKNTVYQMRRLCTSLSAVTLRFKQNLQPFNSLLNIIFPPRCLCCHQIVAQMGALCASCWQGITFNTPPYCAICSHPFEYDAGENTLCGLCIHKPPPYVRALCVFHYDEKSKQLVHNLKYADKTYTAPYLGQWMTRVGADSLQHADLLAPVPLHKFRLFKRYYNQAALLGKVISRLSGVAFYPALLIRVKHTPSQAGLSSKQRIRNVRGVFKLNPNYATVVKGKHIILVDDVMTTGATVTSCTKVLLKAGAARVTILTLARTVKK